MATIYPEIYLDKSTGLYYLPNGEGYKPGKTGQTNISSGKTNVIEVPTTDKLPFNLQAGSKYVLATSPVTGQPDFFTQDAQGNLSPVGSNLVYDKLQRKEIPYETLSGVQGTVPMDTYVAPDTTSGNTQSSRSIDFTSSNTGGSGNTISAQDYQKRPDETVDQYNARIESLRSPTGAGSSQGADITSTGNPVLDQTLSSLQEYLNRLEANGQVINPNIKLDAATLASFTKQAEAEINPYYASQLKLARENLLAGAGYSTNEIIQNEKELERQYGQSFRNIGSNAADQGFALSGKRVQDEQNLATDTQNSIDSGRRQLAFNVGNAERQYAQTYGSTNLPNLQIGNAPNVSGGETSFSRPTGTRSLYTLDPSVYDGLVGSQQYQQKADITNRASQLESAFRGNQAIQQQRSLVL